METCNRQAFRLAAIAAAMAALAFVLTFGVNRAAAADPAVFDVGAASSSINPDSPQYVAGYGYKVGPMQTTHDDLEARAFVVGKGDKAVAFVSVDLVGWFAAYDGVNAPYGIDATRQKIADALQARGYDVGRESVIVSSTHTHSAPAVVGIWGTLDPAYLKKVSDAAVAAATEAADEAQPSEIWSGVYNIKSFIWQNGQGTNHPDGFEYDNALPILWARDPDTGATNALYATVPNHPDQFKASDNNAMSADWPGYARRKLDEENGGTAVLAAGTLGRQEPPGSVTAYSEVIPQGEIVANEIQRTMAKATPITDSTIDASEQQMLTVADNGELLTAINLNPNDTAICLDIYEKCTIPRSKQAPYFAPGPDSDTKTIGTYVEAARIGDVAFATNPGEAFPEINFAIRNGVSGPRQVNVIAQAGDMLGYYYQRDDYTSQQFGSSDFEDYNVGPDLAQGNTDKALAGLAAIGFPTTPQTVHAPFNSSVPDKPGVQWYPDQYESADPTFNILGSAAKSQDGTAAAPDTIDWDFGDGTTDTTDRGERFDHTFPGVGSYDVTATVESNGKTRSWTDTITVDPALSATASLDSRAWNGAHLSVSTSGGQGTLVAARWTCQDGTEVSGLSVTCTSTSAGTASVTAVDGAGNTATTTVAVTKAPPKPVAKLKILKIKVKPKKIKYGKKGTMTVVVKNTGTANAAKLRVCVKVPARAKKQVKPAPSCKSPGTLRAGKSASTQIKVRVTRKARPGTRVKLQVAVTANGTKKKTASVSLLGKPGGMTSSSYAAG
ncbi:MAG: PKD domain-containing protein [Solirubrobacterales bacterium]|nr:PKD domain-containing protein [Solirubrobacterales bacterium]